MPLSPFSQTAHIDTTVFALGWKVFRGSDHKRMEKWRYFSLTSYSYQLCRMSILIQSIILEYIMYVCRYGTKLFF